MAWISYVTTMNAVYGAMVAPLVRLTLLGLVLSCGEERWVEKAHSGVACGAPENQSVFPVEAPPERCCVHCDL